MKISSGVIWVLIQNAREIRLRRFHLTQGEMRQAAIESRVHIVLVKRHGRIELGERVLRRSCAKEIRAAAKPNVNASGRALKSAIPIAASVSVAPQRLEGLRSPYQRFDPIGRQRLGCVERVDRQAILPKRLERVAKVEIHGEGLSVA